MEHCFYCEVVPDCSFAVVVTLAVVVVVAVVVAA